MVEKNQHWVETKETARMRIEQATTLLDKVNQGSGMSFNVFVTSDLAQWLLEKVARATLLIRAKQFFGKKLTTVSNKFTAPNSCVV